MSTTHPPGQSHHFQGADQTRLHYRAWPADSPRAALLVIHGLFEHSGRYGELAAALADAGVATYGLDLRGHGVSQGRRGHVQRFEQFLEDVDRFHHEVMEQVGGGIPRFLLAHSMGGLIGIRYLEAREPALAGAIFTSPWLGLAQDIPGWQRLLARGLSRVLPIAPYPSGIDADQLSHDPERVANYRDDPLIFSSLTIRLGTEVEDAFDEAFRERDRIRHDLPRLFLVAGADSVVDSDRSVELARSLTGDDVTLQLLDGYYHEVLQEVDRSAVMAEIREWIEARLP
ncbi:MAG: alpha/beta hydrolase [Longimicrobiales bacterium]